MAGPITTTSTISAGAEVSIAVDAGHAVALVEDAFTALNMLKLRSGTSAVPVPQNADRLIKIVVRDFR